MIVEVKVPLGSNRIPQVYTETSDCGISFTRVRLMQRRYETLSSVMLLLI